MECAKVGTQNQTSKSRREAANNVWSFLNVTFSKLSDYSNPESLDGIFQVIDDAFHLDENLCFKFLGSSYLNKADQIYLTDYVLWLIGQFTNIITSEELRQYSNNCKRCQLSLVKHLISKNVGVFNSLAVKYIEFITDVLDRYEQMLKGKIPLCVSSFFPSDSSLDLCFGNLKVNFITVFNVRSVEIALDLIDCFLMMMESVDDYPYFNNTVELLDILDRIFKSQDKQLSIRSLRIVVSLLTQTFNYASPCLRTNELWLGRLIHASLEDLSVLILFGKFIDKILTNPKLKIFNLNQLFYSLVYLIVQHLKTADSYSNVDVELCRLAGKLLDKISLDDSSVEESILMLIYFSPLCPVILDLVSKYLLNCQHLTVQPVRGKKRKRNISFNGVEFVNEDKVWLSVVYKLVQVIDVGCCLEGLTFVNQVVKTANQIKETLIAKGGIFSDEIFELIQLYLEQWMTDNTGRDLPLGCLADSFYHLLLLLYETSTNSANKHRLMKLYLNVVYNCILFDSSAASATPSENKFEGCDKHNTYSNLINIFITNIEQGETIELLNDIWSTIVNCLSSNDHFKLFVNCLPTMALAVDNSVDHGHLKRSIVKYLLHFMDDENVGQSIVQFDWGPRLLCLLDNCCYIKREGVLSYKLYCLECDSDNSSEDDYLKNKTRNGILSDFKSQSVMKSVEMKFIEMSLSSKPDPSLTKCLRFYSRHSEMINRKCLFTKWLQNGSYEMQQKTYEMINELVEASIQGETCLINLKSVVQLIIGVIGSVEFWNDNRQVNEIIFHLIKSIARDKSCLVPCWKLIYLFFVDNYHFGKVRLTESLNSILSIHNMSLIKMIHQFKEDFSLVFVLMVKLKYNQSKKRGEKLSVGFCVREIMGMLDFENGKKFLSTYCLSSLIPQLMIECDKKICLNFLVQIAQFINISIEDLILNYFEDIYTEFFVEFMMDEKKLNLVDQLKLIENYSGTTVESLVYASFETLVCKFILNAGLPKIIYASHFLFQNESSNNTIGNLMSKHLLGMLTFIDCCLQSPTSSNLLITKCVKCLPKVILLLGPNSVAKMRFKIFSTLRNGLKILATNNPNQYFTSWALFINSLCEVDIGLIGPSLSSVFTTLVPLISQLPDEVSNLLHFLVVDNKDSFVNYIPDLYFVKCSGNNNQKMEKVKGTIDQVIKLKEMSSSGSSGGKDYKSEIEKLLSHIGNEDLELRLHALNRLHQVLKDNSVDLHMTIVRTDILHPLIAKIIDCLMKTLQTAHCPIRRACASCLGELGAIDPTRIGYNLNKESLNSKLVCEMKSLEFALICVSGLVKGLQNAKDLKVYNTFVGATQEVLKIYFKKYNICSKEKLLNRFPDNVRETLETLFHARYRHMVPDIRKLNFNHPIFGGEGGRSVGDWAWKWSLQLISFIKDPFDIDLFLCCAPCMKIDLDFLLLLLPYILLRALVSCSIENRLLIEEEMKTVLHWKVYGSRKRGIIHIWKRLRFSIDCQPVSQLNNNLTVDRRLDASKCVAIIFDLFDFLYKYSHGKLLADNQHVLVIQNIAKEFLDNFRHKALFVQSYAQMDYCRSLWHVEKIISSENLTEDSLHQLRNVYSKLNDSDGLVGVMGAFQTTPSTEEIILCNVVRGNLQDALICYRMLAEKYNLDQFHKGLIQCYLSIDQPSTALQVTKTLTSVGCGGGVSVYLSDYAEVLWNLLKIDEMSDLSKNLDIGMRDNWCWSVDVGLILKELREGQTGNVKLKIDKTRSHLIGLLSSLSYNTQVTYRQGYHHIIKLHILNEMEKYCQLCEGWLDWSEVSGRPMELRLALIQPSQQREVLNIRRVGLSLLEEKVLMENTANNACYPSLSSIHNEISNIWIKNINMARKIGNFDQALTCVSMAEKYKPVGLFVEKAKLYRSRMETDSAVLHLRQGIAQHFSNIDQQMTPQLQMLCAKAKLLIAQYNDENINVDINEGVNFYKEAMDVCNWEKTYVSMGQYLYRAITTEPTSLAINIISEMELKAADYFGLSMMYGSQFIYQSMPCMLALWLDFIAKMVKVAGNTSLTGLDKESTANVLRFQQIIDSFSEKLPAYMFMTAFTQLISRIGHPYEPCFTLLKKIIVKMINTFPQQACWTFIATLRSPHPVHKKRSMEILKSVSSSQGYVSTFLEHFKELVNKLICLSMKTPPTNKRGSVPLECLVKGLKSFLRDSTEIMVPAQKFRTVTLPNLKYLDQSDSVNRNHYPFPEKVVYLSGVRDDVEILQSLQMPKKVVFYGSDGNEYPLICKPKDDLRLDSRIMEFNSIVNMYLRREPNTRERNLYIRTYSVVPLSNQCGLIEWIPNLLSLKLVILQMYRKKGIHETMNEIHTLVTTDKKLSLEDKKDIYYFMLNKHPPVLHEWMFQQFQTPQTWYLARRGFIRTSAVMSIVGYMEGLGDRHCENILIDSTSADLVHVDFNCLFNKADTFLFPETVPFRLTNNMVWAMGSTKYEGTFTRSCEETAQVMRKYRNHLVATMKPFLHDPKIFQTKDISSTNHPKHLEFINENAKGHINRVDRRLGGVVETFEKHTPPLSVEGQVRILISEATNIDNLARMFPGWTPYI